MKPLYALGAVLAFFCTSRSMPAASANGLAQESAGATQHVEETRRHANWVVPRTLGGSTVSPDSAAKNCVARSTFILRRWKDRKGTHRSELRVLLDFANGLRVAKKTDSDFFTCRYTEEIRFIWGVENTEYLRLSGSLGKCPDFTEESGMKWAHDVATGKLPRAENVLVTVETSTIKVALDRNEWETRGNKEVFQSLSTDFANAAISDIAVLSPFDPWVEGICKALAGLYLLHCETEGPAPPRYTAPDCDFDASFGEPCTLQQQRAFEARKGRGVLNPAPTPAAR